MVFKVTKMEVNVVKVLVFCVLINPECFHFLLNDSLFYPSFHGVLCL